MGLFQKLFGAKSITQPPPPPVEPIPEFPFETLVVEGTAAIDTLLNLRQDQNRTFTPIILGNAREHRPLADMLKQHSHDPLAIIHQAESFDIQRWLDQRFEEEQPCWKNIRGDDPIPSTSLASENAKSTLTAHTNLKQPHKEVLIAKIPTPLAWQVPAYLNYGNWNGIEPHTCAALHRRWQETFSADICCVAGDILECIVARPPQTAEAALSLAREQFLYCGDIVWQGTDTVGCLASGLINNPYWFFWWD